MNIQGERHIFKRFDKEMQYLHDLVVQMGGLAVSQLEDALDTLKTENPEKAYEVISNDRKLNDLDLQADDEIILRNLRDEYIKEFDSSLRNEARVDSNGEEDQ